MRVVDEPLHQKGGLCVWQTANKEGLVWERGRGMQGGIFLLKGKCLSMFSLSLLSWH